MSSNDPASRSPSTLTVVSDAGPLIHLHQLSCIDVLSDLGRVLIPEAVWAEVDRHRPGATAQPFLARAAAPDLSDPAVAALCVAFSLDAGESQCLALLATIPDGMLLTDDAAARLVGERMGLRVHGTIGVLIRAIRRGTRTAREVLDILEELPRRSTLFIQRSLLQEVKERIRGTYSL